MLLLMEDVSHRNETFSAGGIPYNKGVSFYDFGFVLEEESHQLKDGERVEERNLSFISYAFKK